MTVTPVSGVRYWYNPTSVAFEAPGRPSLPVGSPTGGGGGGGGGVTPPAGLAWDWSTTNTPMAAASSAAWDRYLPSGTTIVPLSTSGADFQAKLTNTLNAAGKRVVVDLPGGVYHLTSFDMVGTSGDPNYAFGFWFGNSLQGFRCMDPGGAVIQMDANSMTTAQIDRLAGRTPKPGSVPAVYLTQAAFQASQMGLCRLDGANIWCYNIGFQAQDQNPLDAVASDIPVTVPQSAPHQGVVIYPGSSYVFDRCWWRGAGKAMTSQPPFEHANVSVARSSGTFYNCEFDGRRAASLYPTQPRVCSTIMYNNETFASLVDCWGHHSNVSRYAANDQNSATTALSTTYRNIRCKWEQISNAHNGGLGGGTNATPFGWESTNARIENTDVIVSQDNSFTDGQVAQHFQHTSVGGVNPTGGRHTVTRGTFRNTAWPALDGWVCFRIPTSSHWYSDGVGTTVTVVNADGSTKQPYIYTGTWPPTASTLAGAGVSKDTHYLVRTT